VARTPIIAGNWKMNTTAQTARELAEGIAQGNLDSITTVEKIVCPPMIYLPLVSDVLVATTVKVGAQDMYWEEKGAFTGAVSPYMIKDYATHVIIAHSERRALFGETDETANKKIVAALAAGLTPIVCVGETGAERQASQTEAVILRQVRGAIDGIDLPDHAIIAYEPVWAIGTGVAATAQDAQDACALIRREIATLKGQATADAVRILYGGSVSPANVVELVSQPDVDGGLVGGASLQAQSFIDMVKAIA
jgi:triosephosphate isomerase